MDVRIPELELQHELQRFTTSFIDRVTQATEQLQRAPSAKVREEALHKNLLYASSAMEIATGPAAAVNLLDMFVFLHLSRSVLERHWIPTLYGERGAPLDAVFTKAEAELDEIARRALGSEGVVDLANLVEAWLTENRDQVRVEGIRLSDFAAAAGTAAADRALRAKGILSSIKVATEAANEAMVIADRGMFLFHRLPFLLRLHVRLAVRDVLNDVLMRLRTGPELGDARRLARRGAYLLAATTAAATVLGVMWLRRNKH